MHRKELEESLKQLEQISQRLFGLDPEKWRKEDRLEDKLQQLAAVATECLELIPSPQWYSYRDEVKDGLNMLQCKLVVCVESANESQALAHHTSGTFRNFPRVHQAYSDAKSTAMLIKILTEEMIRTNALRDRMDCTTWLVNGAISPDALDMMVKEFEKKRYGSSR